MAVQNAALAPLKTVGDPNAVYESLKPLWLKSRAMCSGERFVKDLDEFVDTSSFSNILIPFSNTMTQEQFNFYKAEAELPGICAQFSKMIVAGLLRKEPNIVFPNDTDGFLKDWILNEFGNDEAPILSFLDDALWEEVQAKSWLVVTYPTVHKPEAMDKADYAKLKPSPVLYKADAVINWTVGKDEFGKSMLTRIVIRGYTEKFTDNEFHPIFVDTVWVHELSASKQYQVRKFERNEPEVTIPIVNGQKIQQPEKNKAHFEQVKVFTPIYHDEPLNFLPVWPLNGSIEPTEPMLQSIIDKEVALYNKMSRRNHLLYGAATYTPTISSDMSPEAFEDIVNGGLGSWIHLRQGDSASILDTPTAALSDMDRAITANIEELAKLGIRMLTPESNQSGVALELRNANQTARLSTLNNKVSGVMRQVIAFMVNWRFDLDIKPNDIKFEMSNDFSNAMFGEGWLRLATEWYQTGLIPRSTWLQLLKQNDVLPPEYNDEDGRMEITNDLEQQMSIMEKQNPAQDLEENN